MVACNRHGHRSPSSEGLGKLIGSLNARVRVGMVKPTVAAPPHPDDDTQ
jgi:hypothetical protein